jgi:hypothetical protein
VVNANTRFSGSVFQKACPLGVRKGCCKCKVKLIRPMYVIAGSFITFPIGESGNVTRPSIIRAIAKLSTVGPRILDIIAGTMPLYIPIAAPAGNRYIPDRRTHIYQGLAWSFGRSRHRRQPEANHGFPSTGWSFNECCRHALRVSEIWDCTEIAPVPKSKGDLKSSACAVRFWWALRDSNPEPRDYESHFQGFARPRMARHFVA